MDFKLSTCARCDKLFNKILSEVCSACQKAEDDDFSKIHDVLSRANGLNAEQVAAEAQVSLECVLRMLREGRIDSVSHDANVSCGRCGAPAISSTKRLCKRCLTNLDRECAQAMYDMRQRIRAKGSSDMNDVTAAVELRRLPRREQRRDAELPPVVTSRPAIGHRMVVPQQLRKNPGKKS